MIEKLETFSRHKNSNCPVWTTAKKTKNKASFIEAGGIMFWVVPFLWTQYRFLEIWYTYSLGLKDDEIRIWWSRSRSRSLWWHKAQVLPCKCTIFKTPWGNHSLIQLINLLDFSDERSGSQWPHKTCFWPLDAISPDCLKGITTYVDLGLKDELIRFQ